MAELQAPPGTRDVLPPETARWEALLARFASVVEAAGYGLVQSPMFEDADVFRRVGEGTEIVRKEMYEFEDRGGRRLALRPEGTASVARAFVQHRPPTPWKTWYAGPNFRYERPQSGRYRQHHQVGIEAIGPADPDLDVEVIALGHDYLRSLGLTRWVLSLNSMGTPADRRAYVERLRAWLDERRDALAPEDRDKVDTHPMRVLDSKRAATVAATADAPRIADGLSDPAAEHFQRVRDGLSALGISYTIEPRLVRGLDYYTHTTFELQASDLDAAQSTLLGGGRYDGLVEEMGGPPTPGIGFGSGIERVLLACDAEGVFAAPAQQPAVWVVDVTGGSAARDITTALRRAGISADRAFDSRSMRSQMKKAGGSGARLAVIIGEQELADRTATVRDLHAGGGAQEAIDRDRLVEHVAKLLEAP